MNAYAALAWLNFFIADVRDGKEHQFGESHIGLTSASLCALIFGIPLGIFIDKTRFKRGIIALCIVGAGIIGVILPLLVAMLMRGSGHINASFACVMTFGGIGAALSGSLGGFIAQYFGYFYAHLALAFDLGVGV